MACNVEARLAAHRKHGCCTSLKPLLAAAWVVAIGACAKVAPPPGGPEDRTPPVVLAVDPPSGTANVAPDQSIALTFSEPMERAEVERALHLFPAPAAPPLLTWQGNTLRITADTSWAADQTYITTLQADARDRHGNGLEHSWQSAFSTGIQIDSGRILGRIMRQQRPAPGMLALCFRLDGQRADPEADTADYVVQVDSTGRFELAFLSPGSYRVFGLDDRDRDWLWNVGTEQIAVPSMDAELGPDNRVLHLPALHLALLDTVEARLASCRHLGSGYVRIELDRAVDSARLAQGVLTLLARGSEWAGGRIYVPDTLTDVFYGHWPEFPQDERIEVVFKPATGHASETCLVEMARAQAEPVGALRVEDPTRFVPGVTGPAARVPLDLRMRFGQPLTGVRAERIALDRDTMRCGVTAELVAPFTVRLAPVDDTFLDGPITLRFEPGAVTAIGGGVWPGDTTIPFRFVLPFRDSIGYYEIEWRAPAAAVGSTAWLGLLALAVPSEPVWVALAADSSSEGGLLQGDYALRILIDRDGDRRRDPGWPHPFHPSEAFRVLVDTLHVRARFTTELSLPPLTSVVSRK